MQKKQDVARLNNIVALDAKKNTITSLKDTIINQMDNILNNNDDTDNIPTDILVQPRRSVRQLQRTVIFSQVNLKTEADVNRYLANIKNRLLSYINDDEEIEIR